MQQHFPDVELIIPQIAHYPAEALAQVRQLAAANKTARLSVIGSSMGGFLATHLVNEFGARGVLINPAVDPHILMSGLLGEHQNMYTGERFVLLPEHVDELENGRIEHIHYPKKLWVLLQEQDETLDYRQAVKRYQDCQQTVEPGGSHAFDGYQRFLPRIAAFLFGEQTLSQADG